MICQCLEDQLLDLLATDTLRYFAQTRPIIANYSDKLSYIQQL